MFPWVCFKCGAMCLDSKLLLEHIFSSGHRLSNDEKLTLVKATAEIEAGLSNATKT